MSSYKLKNKSSNSITLTASNIIGANGSTFNLTYIVLKSGALSWDLTKNKELISLVSDTGLILTVDDVEQSVEATKNIINRIFGQNRDLPFIPVFQEQGDFKDIHPEYTNGWVVFPLDLTKCIQGAAYFSYLVNPSGVVFFRGYFRNISALTTGQTLIAGYMPSGTRPAWANRIVNVKCYNSLSYDNFGLVGFSDGNVYIKNLDTNTIPANSVITFDNVSYPLHAGNSS